MTLEELFNDKGYSQTDIANKLSINKNTVNRWCRTSSKPAMRFRREIATILKIQVSEVNQAVKNTWADKS